MCRGVTDARQLAGLPGGQSRGHARHRGQLAVDHVRQLRAWLHPVDRVGVRVLLDPTNKPYMRVYTYKRVGGDVDVLPRRQAAEVLDVRKLVRKAGVTSCARLLLYFGVSVSLSAFVFVSLFVFAPHGEPL